jgi:hypothetical protein
MTRRELIEPNGDKRYARRDTKGQFKESDDQGRSLSADRRKKAKTVVKAGVTEAISDAGKAIAA